ncbi:hypothetical protein CEXT_263681 [Caerostris extrusa]|uniref:Uncharacterized protein n=1 Tax=Caerostris extrusa TaxID=172846 RepID=A0AAV4T9L8_CAEEX|nr:hypothetical protein CEXT_263681 [Caerostris extrusa]
MSPSDILLSLLSIVSWSFRTTRMFFCWQFSWDIKRDLIELAKLSHFDRCLFNTREAAQCPQSPKNQTLRRSSPSVKGEIEPRASLNLTNRKFHEQVYRYVAAVRYSFNNFISLGHDEEQVAEDLAIKEELQVENYIRKRKVSTTFFVLHIVTPIYVHTVVQCPQSPNQTLLRGSSPSTKGETEPQASFNLTNQKFHEQSSVLDLEKQYVTCVL